jgi:hypothetical protein
MRNKLACVGNNRNVHRKNRQSSRARKQAPSKNLRVFLERNRLFGGALGMWAFGFTLELADKQRLSLMFFIAGFGFLAFAIYESTLFETCAYWKRVMAKSLLLVAIAGPVLAVWWQAWPEVPIEERAHLDLIGASLSATPSVDAQGQLQVLGTESTPDHGKQRKKAFPSKRNDSSRRIY